MSRGRDSPPTETVPCPKCGKSLQKGAKVCRNCFFVVDREGWQHDAGRLGADHRGGGRPLEDPPVEPIPLTGSGLESGLAGSTFRLLTTGILLRWGRGGRRKT